MNTADAIRDNEQAIRWVLDSRTKNEPLVAHEISRILAILGHSISKRNIADIASRSREHPLLEPPPILGLKGGHGYILCRTPEDFDEWFPEFESTVTDQSRQLSKMKKFRTRLVNRQMRLL